MQFSQSCKSRDINAERSKQKFYHDRTTRDLPVLTNGSPVRLYDFDNENWLMKGKVVEMVSPRSYLVRCENGAIYRRNRVHLRLDKSFYVAHKFTDDESNDMNVSVSYPSFLRRSTRTVKKPKRLIETM